MTVETAHCGHCCTKLRKVEPSSGDNFSWDLKAARNRLRATVAVEKPDDNSHGTVIGQIHLDGNVSIKPVCELFYNSKGDISIGVEQPRDGGNLVVTKLGNVPVVAKVSHEVEHKRNILSVAVDGGTAKKLSTHKLSAPASYFKAGNYSQRDSLSIVRFYAVEIEH